MMGRSRTLTSGGCKEGPAGDRDLLPGGAAEERSLFRVSSGINGIGNRPGRSSPMLWATGTSSRRWCLWGKTGLQRICFFVEVGWRFAATFGEAARARGLGAARPLSQPHAALPPPSGPGASAFASRFFFNLPQPPQNPQPATFSPPHGLLSRTSSPDVALLGSIARSRLQQLPDMVLW